MMESWTTLPTAVLMWIWMSTGALAPAQADCICVLHMIRPVPRMV